MHTLNVHVMEVTIRSRPPSHPCLHGQVGSLTSHRTVLHTFVPSRIILGLHPPLNRRSFPLGHIVYGQRHHLNDLARPITLCQFHPSRLCGTHLIIPWDPSFNIRPSPFPCVTHLAPIHQGIKPTSSLLSGQYLPTLLISPSGSQKTLRQKQSPRLENSPISLVSP